MARQSAWYLLGKLLRQTLSKAAETRRSAPSRVPPRAKQQSASAQLNRPDARFDTYDSSPGQHGPDATRDATAEELRQVRFEYAPNMDRDPDPGEIVWTWVPYVENDGRGKDRPVLIVGRIDDRSVVGCYVSTKQHRGFISIGNGSWDPESRESFLSPERMLRVTHGGMRREGSVLPREVFTDVVRQVLKVRGLSR